MSFADLPYELRSHIWSLVADPRRITGVRMEKSDGKFKPKQRRRGLDILYETTSTPPPAVVQVCREARRHAPYQRCFIAGTEARWTWVNFKVDIFYVTDTFAVSDIKSHRSDIQRLQISTVDDHDWGEGVVHLHALEELRDFTNLKEVKIMLEAGDFRWGHKVQHGFYSHPEDIFTFVDERAGLALTAPQLRLVESWARVLSYSRFRGNPPSPDRLSEAIASAHQPGAFGRMSMAQMYKID